MALERSPEQQASLAVQIKWLQDHGYDLLQFDTATLKNHDYEWIAIDRKSVLGRGSFGKVYKAYPVNPQNGKLMLSKALAIKVYQNTSHVNPSEAKFFDAYYSGCELIAKGEDMYMVMACLPGKNIMDNQKHGLQLNVEISQFDFAKRIELIYNIMLAINLIHNNTPNTGNALIHGDINGSNIKVHYDTETEKIDVYIIDFGLAETTDDPNQLKSSEMEGTPLFMPNELVEHEMRSTKSDIFALTPIFAAILGAANPFSLRTKIRHFDPYYYKTPYDFKGMFTPYQMPALSYDLKDFITRFLERMQSVFIEERPGSNETLRFFTTLNKLCKVGANSAISVRDKQHITYSCGAKLAILAHGLWEVNQEERPSLPSPESFDFDNDPDASLQVLGLATQKRLDQASLMRILRKDIRLLSRQEASFFAKIPAQPEQQSPVLVPSEVAKL